MGLRLKLFLVSLALIVVSVSVADAYLTRRVSEQLTTRIRDDLFVRARLAAREAGRYEAPLSPVADVAAWDALADAQKTAAEVRVTIIRVDGVVVGDSDVETAALAGIENHGKRPEVEDALAMGRGEGMRLSVTVHEQMMYVAVPFLSHGVLAGVTRVAKPLREVDDAVWAVRRGVLVGSAVALLFAIAMSSYAAHRMSQVVVNLTAAAQRMTEGDLAVRTHVTGHDELAALGRALDALAGSLSGTLGELRGERDLLGRILEGMQEGVLVLDADARVVLVNAALRSMLLLGPSVEGKMLIETVRDASLHDLLEHARETRAVVPGEIDLPGIKPRRLLVHAAPLAGEDEGVLAVFVDVTELRRLESLRRDFAANVSHELRTPVAAVRSAAETLRSGASADPETAARFVEIIERNAGRLQALIEDLLELSRLESKELKLKREPVELDAVVPLALALFRDRAAKKGIKLENELAQGTRATGDPRAIEQVVSNLVDNAVKYCPTGSIVAVSAREHGGKLELRVRDTGPGIAAAHLPRIFERFYRVDAGRSRDVGGTGLGLSIVKHLVEAMGGTVAIESELGKGATFIVTLPARPATTAAPVDEARAS